MKGRASAARLCPTTILMAWGVSACGSHATAPADGTLSGRWGGPEAALVVDDPGARVELACAEGRIDGPIVVEKARFDGSGPWQPGPVPSIRSHFAHYSGLVVGQRLELTIVVTPDGRTHGPFELVRNREPTFPRCQ